MRLTIHMEIESGDEAAALTPLFSAMKSLEFNRGGYPVAAARTPPGSDPAPVAEPSGSDSPDDDFEAAWANRRATANTRKEAEDLGRQFAAEGKGLDDAPAGIKGNAKLLEAFQKGLGPLGVEPDAATDDLLAEPDEDGDDEPEQRSYDLDEMTDKADEVLEKLGKVRLREIMSDAGCDEDVRRIKDIPEDLRGAVYRGWQMALNEKGKK